MLIRYLHSSDDGQPEGGDAGDIKASDIINRYGTGADSALRLAEKVADLENKLYRLRETKRALTQERDELKAKLPADGAVVVAQDDAAALEAYRALGKPEEVKAALDAKAAAEGKLHTLERDATLRDVREVTGFDLDVLREIGGAEWQYTIKTETGDAGDVRRVYVNDGSQEVAIDQHPKVQKFLPALKPSAPAPVGTPFPRQSAGSAPAGDLAARFIEQQAAKRAQQPNPLSPK